MVQEDAEASTYHIPPFSFFLSPPQVLCKLEAERRQGLTIFYFSTALQTPLQRGNIVLELYYLCKIAVHGARDNCFS